MIQTKRIFIKRDIEGKILRIDDITSQTKRKRLIHFLYNTEGQITYMYNSETDFEHIYSYEYGKIKEIRHISKSNKVDITKKFYYFINKFEYLDTYNNILNRTVESARFIYLDKLPLSELETDSQMKMTYIYQNKLIEVNSEQCNYRYKYTYLENGNVTKYSQNFNDCNTCTISKDIFNRLITRKIKKEFYDDGRLYSITYTHKDERIKHVYVYDLFDKILKRKTLRSKVISHKSPTYIKALEKRQYRLIEFDNIKDFNYIITTDGLIISHKKRNYIDMTYKNSIKLKLNDSSFKLFDINYLVAKAFL